MSASSLTWSRVAVTLLALACVDENATAPNPGPSLSRTAADSPDEVVVDQTGRYGRPTTIQQGITLVAPGGKVQVRPGTYSEKVVIDKALTLQGSGDEDDHGSVLIERVFARVPTVGYSTATADSSAVRVNTSDPVVIRNVTVHHVW